ncbi:DUF1003 domain-containing protein [Carnobacterium funditum]|uniref:DUF1003 domain-containing protein n=1 Tax=Carnobacterium funditum TaxID=2752 RepID=UPI00054EFAB7|nr:DUF1003 domain-containing protein [Carnobacterium funditum]
MSDKLTRSELAQIILDEELLTNDATEIIEILKDTKVSKELDTKLTSMTFGQRLADRITLFAGSWKFIIIFFVILLSWIIFNKLNGTQSFDPYPFILLNLVLSCVAAIQAPVILMSQNRQAERDRKTAGNDFKVNLKSEILSEDIHDKLDKLLSQQTDMQKRMDNLEEKKKKKS